MTDRPARVPEPGSEEAPDRTVVLGAAVAIFALAGVCALLAEHFLLGGLRLAAGILAGAGLGALLLALPGARPGLRPRAVIALAAAALLGIGHAVYEMFAAGSAKIGSLLMLFLYIEILSMVKGSRLGTREIPIHTPIALAIVAVARYLVVDVEHITPELMLYASGAILVLVIGLKIVSTIPKSDRH